eukprot:GHVR01167309.1.p1 GENE.GHVR01167309.1~~GHVR01167309.1.p1  ORF type:complete len:309 (+),score=78.02 GHVR01167309.1:38-964(+)
MTDMKETFSDGAKKRKVDTIKSNTDVSHSDINKNNNISTKTCDFGSDWLNGRLDEFYNDLSLTHTGIGNFIKKLSDDMSININIDDRNIMEVYSNYLLTAGNTYKRLKVDISTRDSVINAYHYSKLSDNEWNLKEKEMCNSVQPSVVQPSVVKNNTNSIDIYTDGASSNNGKTGARAGVGVYFGDDDPRNISVALPSDQLQTNNRAELTAIKEAIIIASRDHPTVEVGIYTDSTYTIGCLDQWQANWEKNGWRTATGAPVKNSDLIQEITTLRRGHKGGINLKHVKAHADSHGNNQADKLARLGARAH